uniref:C-type lectin domain-containing protein n=1 Tax=Sinocyclocheilus anshuiensis TaxID=1608454 RepID=A0A671L853_9TELE
YNMYSLPPFTIFYMLYSLAENEELQTVFFSSIGNTSYLITINKNWTDAQSYCRQYYTDLPTIHNSTENEYISKMLYSGWYVWIGLFLDSWEWSDKWILFFRHWAAGQPSMSSGPGDCVGMSKTNSGRWAQYSCDLQSPFICYGSDIMLVTCKSCYNHASNMLVTC